MLVACALNAFAPHRPAAALAAIRDAGVTHVEVPLAAICRPDDPALIADEAAIDHMQQLLAEHGLRAATINLAASAADSAADSPSMAAGLQAAVRLGANLVTAAAGAPIDEAQRQQLLTRHRQLGDRARDVGLVVAFETWPGLCGDSRALQQTMQDLDHPALRLNFDTGGYAARNPWSNWEVALQRVCAWLGSLRLTDTTGKPGELEFPPLGQGATIDFTRTLQIVQSVGFRGPATIDFRIPVRRGAPPLEKCSAGLARSVAQLRRGGWFC
jgi:inosose dehydratase